MKKTNLEEHAFYLKALPVNPRPFLTRISNLVSLGKKMDSPEIRACLWVLNYLAYGQTATINLIDEWQELAEELGLTR